MLRTQFTPLNIASLTAWYDASVSTSLYDASSGGSLVAADGTVARWEDLSGKGNHLTQGGASTIRPLRKTAVINARDVVRFDGSDDRMVFTTALKADVHTVFCVAKKWNAGTDNFVIMGQTSSFLPYAFIEGTTNTYGAYASSATSGKYRGSSSTRQLNRTTAFMVTQDSSTPELWVDGSTFTVNDSGTHGNAFDFSELAARRGGSAFYSKADYGEVIHYNRVLSSAERQAVEAYLKRKWKI